MLVYDEQSSSALSQKSSGWQEIGFGKGVVALIIVGTPSQY
jgi:hypothetical protein